MLLADVTFITLTYFFQTESQEPSVPLADEAFVVTHQQLRLKLFHGIQYYPNDNQQTGAGNKQCLSLAAALVHPRNDMNQPG
jgi:hypothetical protein